jgi:hypothetical protein
VSVYTKAAWDRDGDVKQLGLQHLCGKADLMVTSVRAGSADKDAPRTPDRVRANAKVEGIDTESLSYIRELTESEMYWFRLLPVADFEMCLHCDTEMDLEDMRAAQEMAKASQLLCPHCGVTPWKV